MKWGKEKVDQRLFNLQLDDCPHLRVLTVGMYPYTSMWNVKQSNTIGFLTGVPTDVSIEKTIWLTMEALVEANGGKPVDLQLVPDAFGIENSRRTFVIRVKAVNNQGRSHMRRILCRVGTLEILTGTNISWVAHTSPKNRPRGSVNPRVTAHKLQRQSDTKYHAKEKRSKYNKLIIKVSEAAIPLNYSPKESVFKGGAKSVSYIPPKDLYRGTEDGLVSYCVTYNTAAEVQAAVEFYNSDDDQDANMIIGLHVSAITFAQGATACVNVFSGKCCLSEQYTDIDDQDLEDVTGLAAAEDDQRNGFFEKLLTENDSIALNILPQVLRAAYTGEWNTLPLPIEKQESLAEMYEASKPLAAEPMSTAPTREATTAPVRETTGTDQATDNQPNAVANLQSQLDDFKESLQPILHQLTTISETMAIIQADQASMRQDLIFVHGQAQETHNATTNLFEATKTHFDNTDKTVNFLATRLNELNTDLAALKPKSRNAKRSAPENHTHAAGGFDTETTTQGVPQKLKIRQTGLLNKSSSSVPPPPGGEILPTSSQARGHAGR